MASNSISREVVQILEDGGEFADVRDLVAGSRGKRVYEDGDLEAGIWTAGMVQGLIHDIVPAGEIVTRTVAEAENILRRLTATFSLDAEAHS